MLVQIVTENGVKKIKPLTADAGAGNPVGTIVSMYKKSSPSGYLYCDGSTFDETQYPLLYAYLGSNVLPDYREFALVGAEENTTDVYNASTNPTGTIHNHDVYTEGQAKDDQLQEHRQKVRFNDGNTSYGYSAMGVPSQTGSVAIPTYTTVNTNTLATDITSGRSGTVTRGKRKAVYFYIKATSGLSENAQDNVVAQLNEQRSYSTEEVNTGKKWIDGKKIYSKTVDCGALPNDTTKYVAHGISNLGFVVDLYGISSNNDVYLPIPLVSKASVSSNIGVFINGANISIEAGIDRSSFSNTYITIEYTKTTDV